MGSSESKEPGALDAEEYVGDIKVMRNRGTEDSNYLNEELSDFQIFVKHNSETWRFPCHRFMLRKHRSALADHIEKQNSNQMVITSIKPQIMDHILRYIYEKEIFLDDWKMACEVLEGAYQYKISLLVQECCDFLQKSLTFRNVCPILEECDKILVENLKLKELDQLDMESLEELKKQCFELCKNAGFIVLQTKAFSMLPAKLVGNILEIDGINLRSEYSVFLALWQWSKVQCMRQNLPLDEDHIGKNLCIVAEFVRFEAMTDTQKNQLPEFVKSMYPKRLHLDTTDNDSLKENRCVKFPLNLNNDFYFTLIFEALKGNSVKDSPISGSFINCIKFYVKLDAYLISLTTLALKIDSCPNPVQNLKLSSSLGVLFSWSEGCQEFYAKQGTCKSRVFSVDDSTMVMETEFHAVRPLQLFAGVLYALEITPFKKELEWPKTVPIMDKKKSDTEISLGSALCCGLKNITLVQAK